MNQIYLPGTSITLKCFEEEWNTYIVKVRVAAVTKPVVI
jgi:hypothetical protein